MSPTRSMLPLVLLLAIGCDEEAAAPPELDPSAMAYGDYGYGELVPLDVGDTCHNEVGPPSGFETWTVRSEISTSETLTLAEYCVVQPGPHAFLGGTHPIDGELPERFVVELDYQPQPREPSNCSDPDGWNQSFSNGAVHLLGSDGRWYSIGAHQEVDKLRLNIFDSGGTRVEKRDGPRMKHRASVDYNLRVTVDGSRPSLSLDTTPSVALTIEHGKDGTSWSTYLPAGVTIDGVYVGADNAKVVVNQARLLVPCCSGPLDPDSEPRSALDVGLLPSLLDHAELSGLADTDPATQPEYRDVLKDRLALGARDEISAFIDQEPTQLDWNQLQAVQAFAYKALAAEQSPAGNELTAAQALAASGALIATLKERGHYYGSAASLVNTDAVQLSLETGEVVPLDVRSDPFPVYNVFSLFLGNLSWVSSDMMTAGPAFTRGFGSMNEWNWDSSKDFLENFGSNYAQHIKENEFLWGIGISLTAEDVDVLVDPYQPELGYQTIEKGALGLRPYGAVGYRKSNGNWTYYGYTGASYQVVDPFIIDPDVRSAWDDRITGANGEPGVSLPGKWSGFVSCGVGYECNPNFHIEANLYQAWSDQGDETQLTLGGVYRF